MIRHVIIIGAGPAGLSCGYELIKAGIKVDIYEASSYIGGMSRTIDLWGQRADLGPHRFFSKNPQINRFFRNLIREDYTIINRTTRIYYNNKFFHYPLRFFNVLRNLPVSDIARILLDYLKISISPIKDPLTFEEWVTNKFGRKLYEIFFRQYSEKLWGISCKEIDATWAAQRIKTLSLFEAIIHSFSGSGSARHPTLLDQFAYPNNGSGTLYERAAAFITANGGHIHLEQRISKILFDESGKVSGIELDGGILIKADHVVSSMPLTLLVKALENVPHNVTEAAEKLFYRNTILVYLEIDSCELFIDNWIYVHSPEVRHGRITNFRNWSRELYKGKATTILCMEYWAFDSDPLWRETDENIISLAHQEIRKLKLLPDKAMILNNMIFRIPKCYPVYKTGYKDYLNMIERWLDTVDNLTPVGRSGTFKYNNQDHSILMGIAAARKIINGEKTDLWQINTDYDYQEKAAFTNVL